MESQAVLLRDALVSLARPHDPPAATIGQQRAIQGRSKRPPIESIPPLRG